MDSSFCAAQDEPDVVSHGKTNKSQTNAIFCAWICRVFGRDLLRAKRGIADVAGGQGYLSYEFCVRYGIPSTVIDPRAAASQKLNTMLDKKMRRITKNRLKEKYRRLCVSCNESPDGFQGVQREIISHLSSAIDTIEAKPGVKLTDASCTESWTDILFKDPADEEEATAVCEVLAPAHHETGHDVTDDVGGLSRSIDVGADLGNAADADEGNPIFQFLASSPVFRSAVNSALGYAGQSRRGSDGVGAPMDDTVILEHDMNVLPIDDLTILPTVLDSCGLYRNEAIAVSVTSYIEPRPQNDIVAASPSLIVDKMHPPFFHYQKTFSESRGKTSYSDVVTGKLSDRDFSKMAPKNKATELNAFLEGENRLPQVIECTDFSILVGMHSDQATEEIIDLALANGMPFAVVPCCVFPKLFTHRKIPLAVYRKLLNKNRTEYSDILFRDASVPIEEDAVADQSSISKRVEEMLLYAPVVTYEQFIMYLMLKSPRIRAVDLPFEGRNTVLYALPISE